MIVTDEPEKYAGAPVSLAPGVTVRHRDELDAVQRELREMEGCTIIIYDQTCATEKRRAAQARHDASTRPRWC